jgi:tRNA-modifying protein YgfZ
MNATYVYDIDRDVVTVSGPEAGSFLQSLLSQDLDGVAVGAGVPALLLQPQGKLVATMDALRVDDDTWWCITDAGAGDALASGLNRFRIRVKVEIADVSDAFAAVAVRGPGAARLGAGVATGAAHLVPVGWGDDVVGPRADVETVRGQLLDAGVVAGTRAEYEAARIDAGVPRLGVDIDERTIPQEAFLEQRAVSFTKGCFVGQELVCRIDTRGHVNRYLRRVRIDNAAPPAGAELLVGDKLVGALTSVAGDRALAMVRREVEPPANVVVRWPGAEARGHVEVV